MAAERTTPVVFAVAPASSTAHGQRQAMANGPWWMERSMGWLPVCRQL